MNRRAPEPVHDFKRFENVQEVFDKLLELGFFINKAQRDERLQKLTVKQSTGLFSQKEHWFSDGATEIKIIKSSVSGVYELLNHSRSKSEAMQEVFTTAF